VYLSIQIQNKNLDTERDDLMHSETSETIKTLYVVLSTLVIIKQY